MKSFIAAVLAGLLVFPADYALPQIAQSSPSQDSGYPGWHPRQPAPPTASSIPSIMLQCEGDQCTSPTGGGGAVWLFQGTRGQAMWHYGAIASLTVERFDGRTIVIHREDPNPSYSSPRFADPKKRSDGVFFADYVGTIHDGRIDGTVNWNGGGRGTWYASMPQALCPASSPCPLAADQLVQLGQNSLKAKLNYPALRSFWAASAKGSSDGQAFAGVMIRDGIGTAANPVQGVGLLKASANQDNYSGELALSQSYEVGIGVPKDDNEARYWRDRAVKRAERDRQQAAAQQQQNQMGDIVLGVLVLGAIAAMVGAASSDSDSGSSTRSNSDDSYSRMQRDEALSRRADWYSHGGAFGGPPPLWQKGDPIPQ